MNRIAAVAALVMTLAPIGGAACCAETLAEAWSLALANNPQLAAVQLDEAAAHQDAAAAATSRWPTAWAQGSYAVRSDQQNFRLSNPVSPGQQFVAPFAQREGAGAAAGVALPLYSGGEIANGAMSAESKAAAAMQGTASSRLELLRFVGEAYIGVLRSGCELQVAEQNLASLVAHEREVERRFDQECVPRSDLLSAQVATAMAEQLRLRRLHQLDTARGEYNRLLSRPLVTTVELEEVELTPLAGDLESLQCVAWERRPELAQLLASANAHQFEAERLRGTTRPHVNAVGRYDFEENRFQTPQAISTAAIVVDWSFYDAGRSRRAACAEESRASSLAMLAEDLKSRIALEVMTAWNAAHEAEARLRVAARAVEQADENFRVSTLRYERGSTVESEVLDAQARRAQAASDANNAGYDLALAQIRLRYAVGSLCDEP